MQQSVLGKVLTVGIPCQLRLGQSFHKRGRQQFLLFVSETLVPRQTKGYAHIGRVTPHRVSRVIEPVFASRADTSLLHTLSVFGPSDLHS